MGTVIAVLILISIAYGLYYDNMQRRKKENTKIQRTSTYITLINEKLSNMDNFQPTKKYIATDKQSAIAIDKNAKQVSILIPAWNVDEEQYKVITKIFDFKDILEAHILKNGSSVTKISSGDQIGRAVLGGAIAGGTGAIIGALSAEQETSEKVKRLDLELVVNDIKKPNYTITFFRHSEGVEKHDSRYKTAISNITNWHSTLSVIAKSTR